MRFCFRQVFSLILGALVLAILVFVLLFTGLITLIPTAVSGFVFFTLVSALAGGGLLVLTTSVLQADRTPALINAWLCCGDLAGVAAIGAIFSSLITSLTVSLGIGLYIGVALVFFFLFLFFGSLLCLLRRYVTTCNNCNR